MTTNNTGSDQGGGLLPCPFCGAEARRYTIGHDEPNNAGGDVIVCTRCQASSHVEFGHKENLVSRWNTRAHPPERIRELEEEVARLRGRIEEHISFAEDRISDGKEMGAVVWRIALEDIARENRATLAKGTNA